MLHNVHGNLRNHCLLVHTDLTLTTDRLMELFESVEDPDHAGIFDESLEQLLGLSQSAVEEIKRSYQSPTQLKEAYLDTYTHQHPCPSWKKVVETLRQCYLYQQVNEVENTYVQGMHVHLLFVYSEITIIV